MYLFAVYIIDIIFKLVYAILSSFLLFLILFAYFDYVYIPIYLIVTNSLLSLTGVGLFDLLYSNILLSFNVSFIYFILIFISFFGFFIKDALNRAERYYFRTVTFLLIPLVLSVEEFYYRYWILDLYDYTPIHAVSFQYNYIISINSFSNSLLFILYSVLLSLLFVFAWLFFKVYLVRIHGFFVLSNYSRIFLCLIFILSIFVQKYYFEIFFFSLFIESMHFSRIYLLTKL